MDSQRKIKKINKIKIKKQKKTMDSQRTTRSGKQKQSALLRTCVFHVLLMQSICCIL